MAKSKQVTLPVTGMTCANCVATVERNLKKLDGVQVATVNLSSERATVEYDPSIAGLDDLIGRVNRAGYGIATGEADLLVQRMSDDNDARRLEKTLSQLDGVLSATVTFSNEHARVKYIPTIISQAELRRAISTAGFEAVEMGGDAEDAEQKAREEEIAQQKHYLIIGIIFTVPLFLLSMSADFGLLPHWIDHDLLNWLMFALQLLCNFTLGGSITSVRISH
jgi:Cu+-exporting ATPase